MKTEKSINNYFNVSQLFGSRLYTVYNVSGFKKMGKIK